MTSMMRECSLPSSRNLLRTDGSGANKSVCAPAAQAIVKASASKAVRITALRIFRDFMYRRILPESSSIAGSDLPDGTDESRNANQKEGLRHLEGRFPN